MSTKTATTQPATGQNRPKAKPCSCGQSGPGGSGCACCNPVCFERPNYFCGQLLGDDDLTAEQAYIREKQKLYHRSLHGYGIVCGLRLTCDIDCRGNVRIGDGYAIDDCGNDIVVCQPVSFDVLAALKEKHLLISDPPWDPCDGKEPPRCKIKQCFYVTICYIEERAGFTSPFKSSCGPAAAPCEPTRIKETFRFDVLDHPPKPRNYLDEIEERIEHCWKVFTDGPLARAIKEYVDAQLDREKTPPDYCEIFCRLKVLFQHHLKRCPDLYDCTLWEQLRQLECPTDDRGNHDRYKGPICDLLGLIQRYAYDCILGEMIFPCPNPPKAKCVVLGTVEVEDGKVLRVCNCPRTYVWTFANFFEVLLATVVGGAACASHDESEETKIEHSNSAARETRRREVHPKSCCTSFDFNCEQFSELFRATPNFGSLAAAAPVRAIREVVQSLKTGFNFTDPLAFSAEVFEGMLAKDAEAFAGRNADGPALEFVDPPSHHQAQDPIAAILKKVLRKRGDPFVATTGEDGNIATVVPRLQIPGPIMEPSHFADRLKAAEEKVTANDEKFGKQVAELQAKIKELTDRLTNQPAPPATPTVLLK